jgi:hypothetical protein
MAMLWVLIGNGFTRYQLTPWSKVLLERPPVAQLFKNFSTFYGTEDSLLCSQEHATGPYPEPDESSP